MTAPPLPLLHTIAAASAPAIGPVILLPAIVVFAGAICWLWAPRSLPATRSTRASALHTTVAVMAFLAVLPSVIPYDHLLPGTHNDSPAAEATHAQHCHGSPGSCADAPIAAGPGQFIFSDPLVVAPAMLAVLLASTIPALRGISPRPPTRPPRVSLLRPI